MGQKSNPFALRLAINKNWKSSYFIRGKKQAEIIKQECLIRRSIYLTSKDILQVKMERSNLEVIIFITTSNLGYLTGKDNKKLNSLIEDIKKIINNKEVIVKVNLIELRKVFLNSQYIAKLIASKIEARTPFRIAIKTVISKVLSQREIKGIKVKISGRLDGSEIAKTEKVSYGKVPLSTLTSSIDYAQAEAKPVYGMIGVSVWIHKSSFERKKTESFRKVKEERNLTDIENANTKENQI